MAYKLCARVILWGLILGAGLNAQDGAVDPHEVTAAIAELQHTSKELNQAIKLYKADLDEAIDHYDRGYRAASLHIEPADADLGTSENSVARAAVAKLMIARMLAARNPRYNPAPLSDLDRLQDLILKARSRIDASERLIHRLPVVSVQDLGRAQAEWKSQHDQLLKAREAAAEAARTATLSLPIPLPEAESAEEAKDRAWELTVRGPNFPNRKSEVYKPVSQEQPPEVATLPLRWERDRRITLVREPGYRIALTDPGSEDQYGRHLLYQEEWLQSSLSIVKIMRWRVAVDTATGQHILVRRYPVRKHRGDINDPDALLNLDISWRLEPSIGSSDPGRQDMDSACNNVGRDRERLRGAIEDYRIVIRTALAYSDQQQAAERHVPPDAALAPALRERLFAIRGHLARVPEILKAEQAVVLAADGLTEVCKRWRD